MITPTTDQLTAALRHLGWQGGTADQVLAEIVLSFQHPPIPPRCFDCLAYFRGREEGLQGWGKTREEAIGDLFNECEESVS
jgi:hypothetical protein